MKFFKICRYQGMKRFDLPFYPNGRLDAPYTVYFDFTSGTAAGQPGEDVRGGVNFKKQENLCLPDIHNKNMLTNPSFECGLEGWNTIWRDTDRQWDWVPYTLDSTTAYDGKNSLKFNAHYHSDFYYADHYAPNIGPINIIAAPGDYTVSFYAKGKPGENAKIAVWAYNFHKSRWLKSFAKRFKVTPEWKRYQITFKSIETAPMQPFQFFATSGKKGTTATVWLDAVQVEKATKATAYARPPVEGYLITSSSENFISSKDKINGRLRIITAKPGTSGKVRVRVKNFYDEKILDQEYNFKTDASRTTELSLPLDRLPGLGLFVVRCDYRLAGGETYYDYRRYTKIEFQDIPRPHKRMFSADYGGEDRLFTFKKMLNRWKKLGVGATYHHGSWEKKQWDLETSYDCIPYNSCIITYSYRNNKQQYFGIVDHPIKGRITNWNDPKVLLKDYHLEANGEVTPEYQAKLKNAVKTIVKKYPHVKWWCLGGELSCKFPYEWWTKEGTDRAAMETLAKLLKPFVEGVKEANPKAKVFQDCPANMNVRGGILETDLLLEACNKLGVRFDIIAIHPYQFSPESPDLDTEAQAFLDVLKNRGYEKTPVVWMEGMHWGPFDIPQWGTVSSTWVGVPRTWAGTISYDMGWTEKKSAAWYARGWLVSLKYSDRVKGFTAGNCRNNNIMDVRLTPYAAQLIPNTLSCILGDARFKKDVRFAPFMRAYIFEDAQKRPVAAVWNHHEDIDNARIAAPYVTADFGQSLETVRDLMNSPRRIVSGKMRFQINSFPLFFIGKPGTLKQMIASFENAEISGGQQFNPITVSMLPVNETQMQLSVKNALSKEFHGTLNGEKVVIPPSGTKTITAVLPAPLKNGKISLEKTKVVLKSDAGKSYTYELAFNAFKASKIADNLTLDTVNWNKIPEIAFPRYNGNITSGTFRFAWNSRGFYIESSIKDPKFMHAEFSGTAPLWNFDCLQIFIDTMADARDKVIRGHDENDYSYAIFPNRKGNAARMYRVFSVESQLGLATQAPPDRVFADDIPCRFSNLNGVLRYRTFIPAKYLLPIKLRKNCSFGFALFALNSDVQGKLTGKPLTLAFDGKGCHNRPHMYPVVILGE